MPVLLVAYDDSTETVYGRWIHTLTPALKPGQKKTRIRFDDTHRLESGDERLQQVVEVVRGVKRGDFGRPFPVAVSGPLGEQLAAHEFFEHVRGVGLQTFFRLDRGGAAFGVELDERRVRVGLPADVGSLTLDHEVPQAPGRLAADALMLFGALLAKMNRFGESLRIATAAGEHSEADGDPDIAAELATAAFELHDAESLLVLLKRAMSRSLVDTAAFYQMTLRQVADPSWFDSQVDDLRELVSEEVARSIASGDRHVAARWQYNFAQLLYELGDKNEAADWVESAMELDPTGYGARPEPHRLIGGAAWFRQDYEESAQFYRRAVDLGGLRLTGSRLADSLMHAGKYAEAAGIIARVLELGSDNWRDVFVDAILSEVVDHLGVTDQARELSPPEGTRLTGLSPVELESHLVAGDALASGLWLALTQARPFERVTEVFTVAFLTNDPERFALAALAGLHEPVDGDINLFAHMLHDVPEARACLIEMRDLAEAGDPREALDEAIARSQEFEDPPPGIQFVTEFNTVESDLKSESD